MIDLSETAYERYKTAVKTLAIDQRIDVSLGLSTSWLVFLVVKSMTSLASGLYK